MEIFFSSQPFWEVPYIFVDLNAHQSIRPKCPSQFLSTLMATLPVDLNIQVNFCRHKWLRCDSTLIPKSQTSVDLKIFDLITFLHKNCLRQIFQEIEQNVFMQLGQEGGGYYLFILIFLIVCRSMQIIARITYLLSISISLSSFQSTSYPIVNSINIR